MHIDDENPAFGPGRTVAEATAGRRKNIIKILRQGNNDVSPAVPDIHVHGLTVNGQAALDNRPVRRGDVADKQAPVLIKDIKPGVFNPDDIRFFDFAGGIVRFIIIFTAVCIRRGGVVIDGS